VHFTPLPNRQLHGLWQSLIFDSNIKQKLIYYAQTLDCFSMFKLASELEITSPWCINFNRIILLYGPSGTGKTSLCKSLCQQISIRMQNKIFKSHESSSECGYSRFRLIEIPCHSMVSKWFGQSSMIISKYFECIENELKNSRESTYIFILFDEIESLLNSRESSVNNNDPSDVIRIVNTIIIRLDRLNNLVNTLNYSKKKTEVKKKCNFIVLATSNLITLIDSAFLDRADFTQYIGPPGIESIYSILLNCLNELLKYKILTYDGIS
ncbi:AAA-domain-containing protein, partial [Nadsonia fulvescens var. elongata DSM 6958]